MCLLDLKGLFSRGYWGEHANIWPGAVAENKDIILPLEKIPSHVLRMSWKHVFLFLS